MASLANDPGGARRVLVMVDKKRRTVRLGKVPKKQAESMLRHIEALAASRIDGSTPPEQTARLLSSASDTLRSRLSKAGLCEDAISVTTIGDAVAEFMENRVWRSDATRRNYSKAFGKLFGRFGAECSLRDVTEGHADDFHAWLMHPKPDGGGLAESTANKTCALAWTLYRRAIRYGTSTATRSKTCHAARWWVRSSF